MVRNDCSGSIGIGARNQTGINARNGPVRAAELHVWALDLLALNRKDLRKWSLEARHGRLKTLEPVR